MVASNVPTLARTTTNTYDFSTGLVTRSTDVDNNVSTATSYDAFGRPTLVKVAENTALETRTSTEYSDVLRRVIVRSDLSAVGDGKLVTIQHYDPLGRIRLTRQLEDSTTQSATDESTGIKTQTRYRIHNPCAPNYESSCLTANEAMMGSYTLVSNPYRATTSAAASSELTMGWTRSRSDTTGRAVAVQTFGGASSPFPWGSSTVSTGTVNTSYDANFTTVTDQAGKVRRSMVDALGRLTRVDEPNSSNVLGSTTSPNQPTSYTYDALGNLITVDQNTSVQAARSFTYSSLSRLTSAFNPESGTISYKYDDNGNLLVKTDARTDPNDANKKVSTHFEYDARNRVTRRWYNGSNLLTSTLHNSPSLPAGVGATDEARFYYDSPLVTSGAPSYSVGVAKGRLVAQTYGTGTNGDYYAYDALGRATLKIQQTGSVNYQLSASYNLAGSVSTLTYPSGRAVTNSFDQTGRLSALSGNLGDGANRTYATGILYSPLGGLVKEEFGTTPAIYNKLFYNSRGQLAEIRTSTSYTGPTDFDWDRGAIINSYSDQCTGACAGSSMTDNNGNLKKQQVYIPGQQMRWQEYAYDSLNRLQWAREVLDGGAEQWKQQFVYDRYGNRTIDAVQTWGGINEKAFTVNTANNRLGVPAGQTGVMEYDQAGNLTTDTYTGAGNRTYDAENKITSAWGGNNQAQLYRYDASGQRIKRTVDGVETWQVYGFGSELLAEYAANAAADSPKKEYGYRNGQLLITAEPAISQPPAGVNVAAAGSGAVATASTTFGGVTPSNANNGDHVGTGSWWADDTSNAYPDWVQVEFAGANTIHEIDVFGLQQNYSSPVEPTATMTSSYALTNFEVQYWNGSDWATVSGGSVTGNDKVWRKFTFAPLTTSKIRVHVGNVAGDNRSQVVEIEAYGPSNVASTANGAVATASTTFAGVTPSNANNGDHIGTGSWWADDTSNAYPDWIQVEFAGSKTIGEIDVFGLQQNYSNPVEPTTTMNSSYALTDFEVQYWTGSAWTTVPGGSVTGNDKVWRKFTFASLTTSKIQVRVTRVAGDNRSQVVEIEAYSATAGAASIQWLVTDHLGTPRMIFDETGSLANMKRHDYLPFGEELFAPLGGRTLAQGYATGDNLRQQFTAQERDIETGLDYFGARYYSSVQGRFSSVDPLTTAPLLNGAIKRPQAWNAYSYTLNNPLKYVDPDGLRWAMRKLANGGTEYQWFNTDAEYNAAD